jgi:hypothetical protein
MRDDELLRKWVETWRRAGEALEEVRRRELGELDTREAVRQIFDGLDFSRLPPKQGISGLVEQQQWFAKLRERAKG